MASATAVLMTGSSTDLVVLMTTWEVKPPSVGFTVASSLSAVRLSLSGRANSVR